MVMVWGWVLVLYVGVRVRYGAPSSGGSGPGARTQGLMYLRLILNQFENYSEQINTPVPHTCINTGSEGQARCCVKW